jgi:chemotaxis protein CheX
MSDQIEQLEKLTSEAVPVIFEGMLSMHMAAESPAPLPDDPAGQLIASVGFIGDANGVVFIYVSMTFAREITSRMLGIELAEVDNDEMVVDAIGEIGNQVAGYVKSRLCTNGKTCMLTIPSVVRGQRMSVEGSSAFTRRIVGFRNTHHLMWAEVLLKN